MKKAHLILYSAAIIFIMFFIANIANAYQTVLIDFPQLEGWHSVFYETQGSESILQYVPAGQTSQNWNRTLIFHAYSQDTLNSAAALLNTLTSQLEQANSTGHYRYTKYTDMDAIATRCVKKNSRMSAQCEIFRTAKSFEKLISMQYIDKNPQRFKSNYNYWYYIIKSIAIYQSYYREDRVMDKATSFEL